MVSIIIPVYNAEKYLDKCLNSILNQTYKDIEVIVVNDGSTDNSGKLCEEYRKKDGRIKVVHQKNSGTSIARNAGIKLSKGKYMEFVDSDDYIEPDMVEKLVEAMTKNVQLVICGYKSICENKNKISSKEYTCAKKGKYENHDFMNNFGEIFQDNFINSPGNKLYVSYLLKRFELRFIEKLNMGEDLLFNIEYLKVCKDINIISDAPYNYLETNQDSLTTIYKDDLFENQQMVFRKIREFLIEKNCYKNSNVKFVEKIYLDSITSCFGNLYHRDSRITSQKRKEKICEIINDDSVRTNILSSRKGTMENRLMRFMIKNNFVKGIHKFMEIKTFLRYKIRPLFTLLKRIKGR